MSFRFCFLYLRTVDLDNFFLLRQCAELGMIVYGVATFMMIVIEHAVVLYVICVKL